MAKGLIWATAEDLARNRGRVLSLYRQLLRSLNSPALPLNLAARFAKKAELRAVFLLASEERSLHNVQDLIDVAEYSVSLEERRNPKIYPVKYKVIRLFLSGIYIWFRACLSWRMNNINTTGE